MLIALEDLLPQRRAVGSGGLSQNFKTRSFKHLIKSFKQLGLRALKRPGMRCCWVDSRCSTCASPPGQVLLPVYIVMVWVPNAPNHFIKKCICGEYLFSIPYCQTQCRSSEDLQKPRLEPTSKVHTRLVCVKCINNQHFAF